MTLRFTQPDQLGRRHAYLFCRSCGTEHSFGTVYPDGTVVVQFPKEFGLDRKTAEDMVRKAA